MGDEWEKYKSRNKEKRLRKKKLYNAVGATVTGSATAYFAYD